jgi:hemerythrin
MNLNTQLWDRVHTMEFKLVEQLMGRKRDKKKFAKVLVRLAKYLSDQKYTPK